MLISGISRLFTHNMELPLGFGATIVLLIITIFLLSLMKVNKKMKTKKLPPGPWKLPIIGSMHHLAIRSLPQYSLLKLSKRYGPLMYLKFGEISTVVVSSAQMAKLFLKTHDLAFSGRHTTLASDIISYNNSGIAFTPYNNYLRQMRKICAFELLSNNRVKSFSSIREDNVSNLVSSIESVVGLPIDLSSKIYSLTSSVICTAAFGETFPGQSSLISLVREATSLIGGFNLGDFFPLVNLLAEVSGMKKKVYEVHKKIDVILEDVIKKRRECNGVVAKHKGKNERKDLLDVLLRIHQENEHEFPINDDNIKSVILDMFIGGTETSAATVGWAMSELIKNPRVMEKAQSELRQSLNKIKGSDESDLHGPRYLNLVIKETLRLHPPSPLIPRKCTEACEINGYTIPKNTSVIINVLAIGRDPELWEDAEKFMPERFEENMFDFNGTDFGYLPFGAGRRMCPGISFGLATVEIVLSQLLYHFNWKLPYHINCEELDMEETTGLIAKRRNPLCLIADLKEATLAEN